MKLGVVIVHFHTPELACQAIESVRQETLRSSLEAEIVVVDNGSSPAGRRLLGETEAQVIDPGANLGYAGGINRGAQALGPFELFVAMNPDVEPLPGCLRALADAVAAGAGVAGPRFFWDRPDGFLLPPADLRGRRLSLGRFLALRSAGRAAKARRRWRRHARRHWQATEPLSSHALSGALLAIDAAAWRRVGPFDSGYQLYFEETDWLERARRLGVGGRYVPAARAVHRFARSTAKEPRSQAWFEASNARFRRRHYGRLFTAGLQALAGRWPASTLRLDDAPPADFHRVWWLEVAASAEGFPAAGRRVAGSATSDDLLPAGLDPGCYVVRALDRQDREMWTHRVDVEVSRGQ